MGKYIPGERRVPRAGEGSRPPGWQDRVFRAVFRAVLRVVPGVVLAVVLVSALAGCSQFGVPDMPPPPGPVARWAPVYVAYHPTTVLGFGHTGILVTDASGRGYLRYDQYASAEIDYLRRDAAGETWFGEGLTARLPSILGLTREFVIRRAAPTPGALLEPGESLLPVAGVLPGPVLRMAETRFRAADGLERETARRYFWMGNNCHHFVRDVLREGGAIPERYFPKHFIEALLADQPDEEGRGQGMTERRLPPAP